MDGSHFQGFGWKFQELVNKNDPTNQSTKGGMQYVNYVMEILMQQTTLRSYLFPPSYA
jgi:hypothetical protein